MQHECVALPGKRPCPLLPRHLSVGSPSPLPHLQAALIGAILIEFLFSSISIEFWALALSPRQSINRVCVVITSPAGRRMLVGDPGHMLAWPMSQVKSKRPMYC